MGIRDRADEPLKSCGASYTSIVCTENLNASILVMKSAKDTAQCYDTPSAEPGEKLARPCSKSMRSDTLYNTTTERPRDRGERASLSVASLAGCLIHVYEVVESFPPVRTALSD
jgi:hypothetical protein